MNFAIEAKQLVKRYKTQKEGQFAIRNINLEVPSGQLFGLVGPDGAGKTTTLRLLATVLRPTSGKAKIDGFDIIRDVEKVRSHIGYMAQSYGLYPDLSVRENLDFFADLKGVSPNIKSKRIQELMEFARLTNFFNRRSEHLSGGMQKKLTLCCALINDPDLLILDEPTTGVDPVSRRELWQLLTKIINRGKTIILSTPYMDEAERCNLVGILYEGGILKIGNPNILEEQLPFEILEIEAIPRKIMRSTITDHDDVISWRAVGDRMRVAVQSTQKSLEKIKKSIEKNGGEIQNIHQVKKNLEDVFIYLVETKVESGREV
jgi:ABC-2 type transport system ATP-binding protein